MKRKVILFLSVLLLFMSMSACGTEEESSSVELPNDLPAVSETVEEEHFTPTVTVAGVDLREVDLELVWDRDTTFAIGPRGDVFFARQDGTVWNYTYGDGYACFDSSGQGETFEQPVHAFDIRPVRMAIEEHGGVLIDDQGSLWGWGAFSKEVGSFDKIMDHVADVRLSFYEALVLSEDGTLWAWLRNGIEPQLLAENVRACGYSTHPLLLKENGQLVMLELKLNHNETAIQAIEERPLMDDVYALDGSFIYTVDGTLYMLDENLAPVKRFIGAVQAVHSNGGIVILDANGDLWLQEGLTEPQRITENVQKLIAHNELLYIRHSGKLCLFRDGEEAILDTHVLEAATGYMPNDVTHSILYSKGDGILWRKGLAGNVESWDPAVEPKMIADDLLTIPTYTIPQGKTVDIQDDTIRALLGYAALPKPLREELAENPVFREGVLLPHRSAADFLNAANRITQQMQEHNIRITDDFLDSITRFEVWYPGDGEDCILTILHTEKYNIAPLPPFTEEAMKRITSLDDFVHFRHLEALLLDSTNVASLDALPALNDLKTLSIKSDRLTDITPLKAMPGLTDLSLTCHNRLDLSPVANLSALKSLQLTGIPVDDLDFLDHKSSLEILVLLDNNGSCSVDPIAALPSLRGLSLKNNNFQDMDLLKDLKLEWCHLPTSE